MTLDSRLPFMLQKCNEIRKSEGHEVLPLPKWGVDLAASLEVARIRARVDAEEDELRAKKIEHETLASDIADLERRAEANQTECAKLQVDTDALIKETAEGRAAEDKRKEEVKKAIEQADAECKEVEDLRQSIKDLTSTQEQNAVQLKQMVDQKDGDLTELQRGIDTSLAELESIESRTKEADSRQKEKRAELAKELTKARETKVIIENAFKRAQERAKDFAIQPDDELAAEMKQLDDDEEAIIKDAEIEVDELIASK